jgi:hypothetical protein
MSREAGSSVDSGLRKMRDLTFARLRQNGWKADSSVESLDDLWGKGLRALEERWTAVL